MIDQDFLAEKVPHAPRNLDGAFLVASDLGDFVDVPQAVEQLTDAKGSRGVRTRKCFFAVELSGGFWHHGQILLLPRELLDGGANDV